MTLWVRAFVIFVASLVGSGAVASAAQDPVLEIAARGRPRFLMASAKSPTKPPRVIRPESVPWLQRRIAVGLDNVTLEQAVTAIAKKGGLRLVYSRSLLGLDTRVQLRAEDISVAGALAVVLLDAGIDVLVRADSQAVLLRRDAAFLPVSGVIVGHVVDGATKQPISGGTVALKGTPFGATTSADGQYQIVFDSLMAGEYTVQARRIGYAPIERQVSIDSAYTIIRLDLALQAVATRLEDVITTATGSQRRRDLGNAITTIRADSVMRTAPIKNLTDLLEDRVPGLTSQRSSGAPGDPARLRLRGAGSIMRSNDPIVFVDGVRVYAAQTAARSGNLSSFNGARERGPAQAAAPSPLDQIDPNSIETIEVFKGPSAATLYGADAANGVIVVTTKRGRPGPPVWTATLSRGRSAMPQAYPLSYFRWGHRPGSNYSAICPRTVPLCIQDSLVLFQALNDPDLTPFAAGNRSSASMSVQGGSQALTYAVTASYNDEVGLLRLPGFEETRFRLQREREAPDWMKRPHKYTFWSVGSNLSARLSPKAEVSLSTSLGRSDQQRSSLESQLADMGGLYVDKVNGLYYRPAAQSGTTTTVLPGFPSDASAFVDEYYRRTTASTITFKTSAAAAYRPTPWLNFSGAAGLEVVPRDDQSLVPNGMRTMLGSSGDSAGLFSRGTGRSSMSTLGVRGTANVPLRWGVRIISTIGADVADTKIDDLTSSAQGLTGTSSLNGAASISVREQRTGTSTYGWFAETKVQRGSLTFPIGVRFDGGDANGQNTSLVPLPKLAVSWVVSDEPFFPFAQLFASLRLRASYGVATRHPAPGDRYRLFRPEVGTVDGKTGEMLLVSTRGNTQLRPERSKEFEAGFEATMLNGRLEVEMTGYRTHQHDLHLQVRTPPSVAIPFAEQTMITNIGLVRNSGFESTITVQPIQNRNVTWSLSMNVSHAKNVVLDVGNAALFAHANSADVSGLIPKIVKGYPTTGLWALPIVATSDWNNDGALQKSEILLGDSAVYLGNSAPRYTSALFSTMSLFNGALSVNTGFNYNAGGVQADLASNWAWSAAFSDPSFPATAMAPNVVNTGFGRARAVSTFRFQSASVNYRVPERLARFVGAQQLNVALQGSNLAMHSSYSYGRDPNVNGWSSDERTYDSGQLPMPREWSLSVNVKY